MIKYFIIILSSLSFLTFPAFGATDGGTGCGLGTKVLQGNSGRITHSIAAFLNLLTISAVGPSFSFSMSSNTSGCDTKKRIQPYGSLVSFIHNNKLQFAADLSRGEGEYLENFTSLMAINKSDQTRFKIKLKSNFSNIFESYNQKPNEIMDQINLVLEKDPAFYQYTL